MTTTAHTILIIDDDRNLTLGLSKILGRNGYQVHVTHDGKSGLIKAVEVQPELILLDIGLPGIDGFQVKNLLGTYSTLRNIPVIFISARAEVSMIREGLQLGSYDYITKPFNTTVLLAKIEGILKRQTSLEDELQQRIQESNEELIEETLLAWTAALEVRMYGESGHSRRVTDNALVLARLVGYPEEKMSDFRRGALLHDIGKIGIPDAILFKEGPLDDEEWSIMKTHPVLSKVILKNINVLASVLDIPMYHHENYDGSGYPFGLAGEAIPLAARIFNVIDVYDALLTHRIYRPAFTREKTLEIMLEDRGRKFDPHILDIFLENMELFETVLPQLRQSILDDA